MKKKVVVFHPALAPYRIDFFNSLHDTFDVSFYFEHQMPAEQSFDMDNLNRRIRFFYSLLPPGVLGIKNLRLSIFKILRRENPDIVFVSEYTILGLLVVFYKLFFNWNLKIVIICDDNMQMVQSVSMIKQCIRFLLLHHVDWVLLVNDKVKDWYEKYLQYKATYFYFPIVQSDEAFRIRLEKAKPLSIQLWQSYCLENKKVLLYVGRLVKLKNINCLLSVFREIVKVCEDVKLIIVGDGEESRPLQHQVRDLIKKGYVIFVGKKEGDELMAYYNLGDILILPSKCELFGAVVNEALLSGCYVLCSSVAGASCLIKEGVNGFVFDPDNEVELLFYLQKTLRKIPYIRSVNMLKSNKMLFSYQQYYDSFICASGAFQK